MHAKVSARSEISRLDAACGVAMIVREMSGANTRVVAFGDSRIELPARRGFALRDAVWGAMVGHATHVGAAVRFAQGFNPDRIIVITDEQSWDPVPQPHCKGYMIDIASNQFGVAHGAWVDISGWSDSVIDFIFALEESERESEVDGALSFEGV